MKCEMIRVVNTNYVKYETLTQLIQPYFSGSKIDVMAIYIDMYSICKSLYNDNIVIEDYTALTSSIVNMVAHYRDYFRRIGVQTVFFIIQSDNHAYFNTQLIKDYNGKVHNIMQANPKVYDMTTNNDELLELICKYLPGVYYLRRTAEASVIMYDIMCKYDMYNKYAHMIISKDIYTWQLVSMKPNTVILRPKKKDGNDISSLITRENVMDMYYMARKAKCYSKIISPELLTLLISCTSLPDRNIKTMLPISKATKLLEEFIMNNQIINAYNSDPMFIYNLMDSRGADISPYITYSRFKAIDVAYQQLVFMNTLEADYSKEIVNLKDKEGIQEINNVYFREYPLDLNRL